jgi:hypothetical protein
MRWLLFGGLASLSLATLALACTAFDGSGGTPSTDAGPRDEASAEGDAGDATTLDVARPVAVPTFCQDAGTVTLCDDFERVDVLGGGWTRQALAGGGTLAIVGEPGARKLRAMIPDSVGAAYARLERDVPLNPSTVRLDFDLSLDAFPQKETRLVSLTFEGIAKLVLLVSATAQPRLSVDELTSGEQIRDRHPVPDNILQVNKVQRIQLRFDFVKRQVAMSIDGTSALAEKLALSFDRPPSFTALVGAVFADPSAATGLQIGNFVLDAN